MFFALGRATRRARLACLAVALLVGTKITGVLALPVLLAVGGPRRIAAGSSRSCSSPGLSAALVRSRVADREPRRRPRASGRARRGVIGGSGDGGLAIAARLRAMRSRQSSFREPPGRDRFLYLVAAATVVIVGVVLRRPAVGRRRGRPRRRCRCSSLPAERALHSVYWHGWELVGYEEATSSGRHATRRWRPSGHSWYGTVGLALTLVAIVLVRASRATRTGFRGSRWSSPRRRSSSSSGTSGRSRVPRLSGRFVMGGVASRPPPGASSARSGPASRGGRRRCGDDGAPVARQLGREARRDRAPRADRSAVDLEVCPREWVQNTQPELAARDELRRRSCSRRGDDRPDPRPRGPPLRLRGISRHRSPNRLRRLARRGCRPSAEWAVLPLSAACEPDGSSSSARRRGRVYRHTAGATCR